MKTRIVIALLSVVGLITLTGCDSSNPKTSAGESVESLTVGIADPRKLSSLIWIAQEQGYFADHGLTIDVKWYESGMAAAKDLLAGKLDIATASEFVAACHILDRTDLRIITSLCESDDVKLVARKDHGINRISDMRHKRVGVVLGSGAEFSLDLELALQNIPTQEVQKVDLMPSDQVKAISKGDVDAVALWEPFVSQVSTNLGVNAVSLSFQSEHTCYWLLLCTADGIAKRSRAIRDFVSSMILAEEFTDSHTDEAERIAARKLGLSHVKSAKPATRFTVGLDHPLVLTMETEMRWMNPDIERKRAKIPDILSFIYFDAFNSVHAERIKILH